MENAQFVDVLDTLEQLLHVLLDARLGQVVPAAADGFVHIHVHEFEDEGQAARRFVVEYFDEFDDVGLGRAFAQGLDFTETVYLFY